MEFNFNLKLQGNRIVFEQLTYIKAVDKSENSEMGTPGVFKTCTSVQTELLNVSFRKVKVLISDSHLMEQSCRKLGS